MFLLAKIIIIIDNILCFCQNAKYYFEAQYYFASC